MLFNVFCGLVVVACMILPICLNKINGHSSVIYYILLICFGILGSFWIRLVILVIWVILFLYNLWEMIVNHYQEKEKKRKDAEAAERQRIINEKRDKIAAQIKAKKDTIAANQAELDENKDIKAIVELFDLLDSKTRFTSETLERQSRLKAEIETLQKEIEELEFEKKKVVF